MMQRAHDHSKIPKSGCKDLKLEKPKSGKGKSQKGVQWTLPIWVMLP